MTMGRRRQFDDLGVARAARDVFWERGYASTSLADLEVATGLSRSSLYQAYGSKMGLFDRAVASYCDDFMWPIIEPLEADGAGRDEIIAYFLALAHHLRGPVSVASRGCLMANTASELTILGATATEAVRAYRDRRHRALLHALKAVDGIQNSEVKAELLSAAQMGLMITARFDPARAAAVAEAIAADVKTW
ncbi:helix-turn-helix domain-containing protein [Mycolicibacterium sp. 050158]|uniref:TetR/AcrR family transcriptional regulator n=1 Tax=Mycolicibacterium sp. 050158 TaxID=3090602 RepID=UPI00299DDDE0|nr:helix-turn-helix domain-containing protein [Mycolicibacterium sp. 050158]MDX1892691.1 helix-turn-helix domain-containing protein [Mycolicibacterium sp. 050158]